MDRGPDELATRRAGAARGPRPPRDGQWLQLADDELTRRDVDPEGAAPHVVIVDVVDIETASLPRWSKTTSAPRFPNRFPNRLPSRPHRAAWQRARTGLSDSHDASEED